MKKYITPQPGPTPKPGDKKPSDEIRYKPPFIRSPKPTPKPKPKPKPKKGPKPSRSNDTIMSRIKPDGTRVLTTRNKKSEGYR